jgi:hypothetical protein
MRNGAFAAALLLTVASSPVLAQDAMSTSSAMGGDAMMSSGAMGGDAMAGGTMADDMAMANDTAMGSPMMGDGRAIEITIEDVTTGQPFSPSVFESHTADATPLFKLGDKAPDALVAVAEGGNIGMFSVMAAKNKDSKIWDAQLAIHTLPGQKRTIVVHVDKDHPLIDAVWMLGNTNDGFSGFAGFDAYSLTGPKTIEVRGYDAGSEKNSEKKGFLGALGGGNDRDPENGVITYHTGIRGDADAPKAWNWDINGPVAKVTFTPLS